jgi:Immunoglobulin domain
VPILGPAVAGFQLSGPPSATAGVPFSVTITALLASGAVDTGYSGAVNLVWVDPLGEATASSATLTNGVGTGAGTGSVPGSELLAVSVPGASSATNLEIPVFGSLSILTPPVAEVAQVGSVGVFWVLAAGAPPLAYQWSHDGIPIPGATSAVYGKAGVQAADAGNYTVTVTDNGGSVTSSAASLTVTGGTGGGFGFSLQPGSAVVPSLGSFVLTAGGGLGVPGASAGAGGSVRTRVAAAVSYQWFRNDVPVAGATDPTLVVNNATAADSGTYFCLATAATGAVASQPATIAVVNTTDPGRLVDLSARGPVGAGPDQLIIGCAVGGAGTAGAIPILVRASGPALAPFGVAAVLPDPQVTLFGSGGPLAANAGWGGDAQIAAAAAQVGAFAWGSPGSHDAALLETLPGGDYTVEVSGVSGDSGVALAELYDASAPGTYQFASPRLVNVSARAQVGTGTDVLIAGFVIGGSTSKTVLIRASGPALATFGLTGILADPALDLYQANPDGTSTLLQSNTGWGGTAPLSAAAAAVGAFSWGNSATADSALLVTLPPGAYSAVVSGATGDSGISLVEVYDVP